jgi:ferredoxin
MQEVLSMPKVEVEGRGTFEVPAGTKLVLALEDNGVDILHRCGGNARCTTCRVEVLEGDAGPMTEAEQAKLNEKGMLGQFRLSCQVRVQGDLKIRPAMTVSASGMDAGPRPVD